MGRKKFYEHNGKLVYAVFSVGKNGSLIAVDREHMEEATADLNQGSSEPINETDYVMHLISGLLATNDNKINDAVFIYETDDGSLVHVDIYPDDVVEYIKVRIEENAFFEELVGASMVAAQLAEALVNAGVGDKIVDALCGGEESANHRAKA